MATLYYRQCHLIKRQGPTRTVEITSWIPEKFARLTDHVQLKQADGSFDDGWQVASISDERLREDHLPNTHAMIKGHKRATGDALPKRG